MATAHDLVIRNGYLHDREEVLDIGIENGRIDTVGSSIGNGDDEIDAGGNLIAPGFVDCHVHLDQALTATGDRTPRHNDRPFEKKRLIDASTEYFRTSSREEIEQAAVEAGRMAVANGTLHARTHAYVDGEVGTKIVEAVLDARERLSSMLDLQVVAFPQRGILTDEATERAVRDALDAGADLVGGIDPATVNGDVSRTVEAWFNVAADHDADIDVHVHEPGTLGMHVIDRIATETIERGFEGRVTASHAFALADVADDATNPRARIASIDGCLDQLSDASLSFVTCYQSTRPGMPIRRFLDEGLTMGHGTDIVSDLWVAHGSADSLEAARIESFKLDTSYSYATNDGLELLWRLVTEQGAAVLDLDGYRIDEGTAADLVVHREPSPQWAVLRGSGVSHAIKDGAVVATNGNVTADTS